MAMTMSSRFKSCKRQQRWESLSTLGMLQILQLQAGATEHSKWLTRRGVLS